MFRSAKLCTALLLLSLLAGCSSTSIRSSWTAPNLQTPLSFDKILVVFMDSEEGTRREAEDALVELIGSDKAVASYTLFSADEVQNAQSTQDAVRSEVQSEGFDAAVTMRLVDSRQELNYTPGMVYPAPYAGFYGFYGYGWGAVYSPGYLTTNNIVSVETNIYDLSDNKLVFSGTSDTYNPSQIRQAVDEIAKAIITKLRKDGLVG